MLRFAYPSSVIHQRPHPAADPAALQLSHFTWTQAAMGSHLEATGEDGISTGWAPGVLGCWKLRILGCKNSGGTDWFQGELQVD